MKKIFLSIILFLNIFLLFSCQTIEEFLNKKFLIIEKGDFIVATSKENKTDNYSYIIIGLSESGKIKKNIVFPQKIENKDSTTIGFFSSFFGFSTKNYNVKFYNQNKIYLNKYNEVESSFNFKHKSDIKIFIPNIYNSLKAENWDLFNKNNINNNTIYLSYLDYKIFNNDEYNMKPANITYYLDENDIFFLDDADNSKVNVLPPIPYKRDYKFVGWYKNLDFNEIFDFKKEIIPPKKYDENGKYIYNEIKIYAKWEKL